MGTMMIIAMYSPTPMYTIPGHGAHLSIRTCNDALIIFLQLILFVCISKVLVIYT